MVFFIQKVTQAVYEYMRPLDGIDSIAHGHLFPLPPSLNLAHSSGKNFKAKLFGEGSIHTHTTADFEKDSSRRCCGLAFF